MYTQDEVLEDLTISDTSSDKTLPQTSTQTTIGQRIVHAHTTSRARGWFYRCLKNARKLFCYPRSFSLKWSCSCIVWNGKSVGWLSTKIFAQGTLVYECSFMFSEDVCRWYRQTSRFGVLSVISHSLYVAKVTARRICIRIQRKLRVQAAGWR